MSSQTDTQSTVNLIESNVVPNPTDVSVEFTTAAQTVLKLRESPTNEEKLKVYSLYKQATQGKCNTECPGFLDFAGKAKWNAWNDLKDKESSDAQKEYIALIGELAAKYGLQE